MRRKTVYQTQNALLSFNDVRWYDSLTALKMTMVTDGTIDAKGEFK